MSNVTKRVYAPLPHGKRLLVEKVTTQPVVLKGSGLALSESKTLTEATVISIGPKVDIKVQSENRRGIQDGDLVLFNPNVTGMDVSRILGEQDGHFYVIFDDDVVMARAVEDPEELQAANKGALIASLQT